MLSMVGDLQQTAMKLYELYTKNTFFFVHHAVLIADEANMNAVCYSRRSLIPDLLKVYEYYSST